MSPLLHLHHASVGLLLLPLAQVPGRGAALWAGVGTGLFVDGFVAWGWDVDAGSRKTLNL